MAQVERFIVGLYDPMGKIKNVNLVEINHISGKTGQLYERTVMFKMKLVDKDNEFLCEYCYSIKYDIMDIEDDNYVWISLIKCDICGDQPVIWFEK